MRTTFIFILTILLSSSLRAEYNGIHIRFTIEDVNEKIFKGYTYRAHYLASDSLEYKSTEYLKGVLEQETEESSDSDWTTRTNVIYYKDRITYDFMSIWEDGQIKTSAYYLLNKTAIPLNSIKKIVIDELIDYGYDTGIVNTLTLSDTTWLKKKPVKVYHFNGDLSDYDIFIHKMTPKIQSVIKQLEKKQKEINLILEKGDYDEDGNYDKYREEKYKTDRDLLELIIKLNKQKVVIIGYWTC